MKLLAGLLLLPSLALATGEHTHEKTAVNATGIAALQLYNEALTAKQNEILEAVKAIECGPDAPPVIEPPVIEPPVIEPPVITPPVVTPPVVVPPPPSIPLDQVQNPNPEAHPEFTALLQSPNLVWADSLRPLSDDKVVQDKYYGIRRHGGSGRADSNPRVSYDPDMDAAKNLFIEGEKGQLGSFQTRIRWPEINRENAKVGYVRWEYRIPITGWRGGKQFQIATTKGDLHYEFQVWGTAETNGSWNNDQWAWLPNARVYRTYYVGERGLNDLLVGGSAKPTDPDYCTGIFTCPLQPASTFRGGYKSSGIKALHEDGTLYAVRPNVWMTIEVFFDWRDPDNNKVWMFMSDKDTPRRLVIGTQDQDGYPLTYKWGKHGIAEWWAEFNNSSGVNWADSYVHFRNVVAMRDIDPVTQKALPE